MQKAIGSMRLTYFLFISFLCPLAAHAQPFTVTCPAYRTAATFTISGSPAEPIVLPVPRVSYAVNSQPALLCQYAVQLTGDYPAPSHAGCPARTLTMQLAAPNSPPATGFTSWSFGTPGTPKGSSSSASAPQAVTAAYTPTPSPGNCQTNSGVSGSNVFRFQIYSDFPAADTCTAAQTVFNCSAPLPTSCPATLTGSKIPTVNWSTSSSAPGYYSYESAILDANNAAPLLTQPSLSAIKTAMGSAFAGAVFAPPPGVGNPGTMSNLPPNVFECLYDSPKFTYNNLPAKAQVVINCTTSCGSL